MCRYKPNAFLLIAPTSDGYIADAKFHSQRQLAEIFRALVSASERARNGPGHLRGPVQGVLISLFIPQIVFFNGLNMRYLVGVTTHLIYCVWSVRRNPKEKNQSEI